MKKISVIISIVTAIIFALIIVLSGGKVIDINIGAIGPIFCIVMLIWLSYGDINFRKSGADTRHTNEAVLYTYEERVDFYKARGTVLLSGIVAQVFFIFCFGELLKSLACVFVFLLSFGIASFFAGYSIKDQVNSRTKREEDDLKAQTAKEEQGRI